MSLRHEIVALALLAALSLAGAAHARPLTTAPGLVLTVHVTITDTRIALSPRSAPRGVYGRFIVTNAGSKVHNFTLSADGATRGFSRTLKPRRRAVVERFLDARARVRYFSSLPADRSKPGMKGFFSIH